MKLHSSTWKQNIMYNSIWRFEYIFTQMHLAKIALRYALIASQAHNALHFHRHSTRQTLLTATTFYTLINYILTNCEFGVT